MTMKMIVFYYERDKRIIFIVVCMICKGVVGITSSLKVADLEKEKMFSSTNEELNYPPYVASQRDVENWSLQGLSKRATMVRAQYVDEDNSTWTLKEVCVLNNVCQSINHLIIHLIIVTSSELTYHIVILNSLIALGLYSSRISSSLHHSQS